MNKVTLQGIIKDIEPSHTIDNILYNKARLIVQRSNGREDVLNLKFKKFSNPYKENDTISLTGNIRSYSYKVDSTKNKVNIYVFTYFDAPEIESSNQVELDGRICKMNELRTTKQGKHNVHFIVANNIVSEDSTKRLNSYIPCIAWGKLAHELSNLPVNTQLAIKGELHSREHKKKSVSGDIELCVAHEVYVESYEVIA